MDEHILATATLRLNKSIALGRVEPLHCAFSHFRQLPDVDPPTISSGPSAANPEMGRFAPRVHRGWGLGGVEESVAKRPYARPGWRHIGIGSPAAISFCKRCAWQYPFIGGSRKSSAPVSSKSKPLWLCSTAVPPSRSSPAIAKRRLERWTTRSCERSKSG